MNPFAITLYHVDTSCPSVSVDSDGYMFNLWSEDDFPVSYRETQEWLDEFHPLRVYERYKEDE